MSWVQREHVAGALSLATLNLMTLLTTHQRPSFSGWAAGESLSARHKHKEQLAQPLERRDLGGPAFKRLLRLAALWWGVFTLSGGYHNIRLVTIQFLENPGKKCDAYATVQHSLITPTSTGSFVFLPPAKPTQQDNDLNERATVRLLKTQNSSTLIA